MPNGGSDCCGTCWFNSKNEDKPGYHGSKKEGKVVCQIRAREIDNPFWTYCINHPRHNPQKIKIPLGPVYSGEDRQILFEAPDNEAIRQSLLKLLEEMEELPRNEYPFGRGLDEQVIVQIGKLNEQRAINSLRKITTFNPRSEPIKNPFGRNRIITVGLAVEILAKLSGNEAIPEIKRLIKLGLEDVDRLNYDPRKDDLAPIRYHSVRGLKYCDSNEVVQLLETGMSDPHQEIRAFSKEIIKNKIGFEETLKIEQKIQTEEMDAFKQEGINQENRSNRWWEFWKKNK